MVFSSPVFIFYFLPLSIISYFIVGKTFRSEIKPQNIILLFFSLLFYLYGSGKYILLVFLITLSSYFFGLVVETAKNKFAFPLAVAFPLAFLFVFKYANFFTLQLGTLADSLGLPQMPHTDFILPIGISFYTFQCLSYVVDVYTGKEKPEKHFLDLFLYISMFPQLIAGPIVRYSKIAKQLHRRKVDVTDFAAGASRFIYGLSKKVIIADACGMVADTAYGLPAEMFSTPTCLIGAFAYFLQIYFDFSAYSDMAIGMGRIFGYRFPENFYRPYSSASITEFWRRWHMTMSFWFRDYLYFPLGGSRKGPLRTYCNLWIVFLCTGLWHGANWTFLAWGIYHGVLLSIERILNLRTHETLNGFWKSITILIVYLGWIVFRADSIDQALSFYSHIFFPTRWTLDPSLASVLTHKNIAFMLVGFSSILFPKHFVVGKFIENESNVFGLTARFAVMSIAASYAALLIASDNYSPFIYFQF